MRRLFFRRGGPAAPGHPLPNVAESLVMPMIIAQAREHFDPAEFTRYLEWRLLYVARHGRIADPEEMFVLRGKTSRDLDRWVVATSDMLKAEIAASKKPPPK